MTTLRQWLSKRRNRVLAVTVVTGLVGFGCYFVPPPYDIACKLALALLGHAC